MNEFKIIIRKVLPDTIYELLIRIKNFFIRIYEHTLIKNQQELNNIALEKLKTKAKENKVIKVAFNVEHSAIWKYEGVYKLFKEDDRFDPIIIVVPVKTYGHNNMVFEMEKAYENFKSQGYNVIKTYDDKFGKYLDLKKEINPDIVFYTRPYKGTVDKRYFITKFNDILTCYVNYTYSVSIHEKVVYKTILTNIVWKFFLENDVIYQVFYNHSRNKAINGIVSGYPGVEGLEYGVRNDNYSWKLQETELKRIIWAPHHTIEENEVLNYSNFLYFFETMLKIAEQRKDKIQMSFKPHPLLKVKLYNHKDWGKERTDSYYKRWATNDNTQLDTDLYIDLFNSSDALIHDCASFTAEYLHCGKPVLFIFNEKSKKQFNEFGKLALNQHYHAVNENQIIEFIDNVVCGGNDVKKDDRKLFYDTYLLPPNNKKASENIYNEICSSIWN